MSRTHRGRHVGAETVERIALGVLVAVVGILALSLHRRGHAWGDDFALYLDQARSLWHGDVYEVIEDNRFSVLNSAQPTFSPSGYPWGWPLVLSPFVALIGLDLDRLAVIEVVLLCLLVVALHRLVRRRTDAVVALLISAVVGLSPSILSHTDNLLTEIPHLLVVVVTLNWLDRIAFDDPERWHRATTRDLVVLGLLATFAFNIRREGAVLVLAILAAQCVARAPWRRAIIPHLTFAAAVVTIQLALPTALLPRYPGEGFANTKTMLGEWLPGSIARQLSFGTDGTTIVRWLLVAALVGGLARLVHHARTDIALVIVPLGTLVVYARFPFGFDPRYYIQVVPFVIYAIAQLPPTLAELTPSLHRDRGGVARAVALGVTSGALVLLACVQVWHLPAPVRAARNFDTAGEIQVGAAHPEVRTVFEAVDRYTPPDAVVAFMKARTMTLYTDRRSLQSDGLDVILRRADYFAMWRGRAFGQPLLTRRRAAREGLTAVWRDARWVLWHVDRRPDM